VLDGNLPLAYSTFQGALMIPEFVFNPLGDPDDAWAVKLLAEWLERVYRASHDSDEPNEPRRRADSATRRSRLAAASA
jgi:hypothetical protein